MDIFGKENTILPATATQHKATADPKSAPSLCRERSVQFPVQQGPTAPTARLSVVVTMVAPAPQLMVPAPARKV
jgi:hypothetical protein